MTFDRIALVALVVIACLMTFTAHTNYRTTQLFACPPDQIVFKGDYLKLGDVE